jgi:hypothetical protein
MMQRMNPRRVVRLSYHPAENGLLDLPINAMIVAVEWKVVGGLPSGAWVEEVVDRYDRETGVSMYRDELPPAP